MSTLVTTYAIMLNRRPWSESSQIVTMLTPEHGRLGVLARGARKLTSGFGPALEPITESEVVLSLSPRSDLAHLKTADAVEFFGEAKRSFVRVTLAMALCELAGRVVPEGEANPAAYEHVRAGLAGIDRTGDRDAVNWLWWSALALAADLGYAVQADSCVHCGSADGPHRWFSAAEGGPVCADCGGTALRQWDGATQEGLRWLLHAAVADIGERRLDKPVNRELRRLVEDYYGYHIPNFSHLKSLDLLTSVSAPTADSERDGQ